MDEWTWLQYCSQVLSMTYADPGFLSNMWFSDECHIHLNGYINRQTTRFLGFERPDVVIQKPLHSAQVMIWCTVSIHGILGPYFVEDVAQNPLTVNQEHYREIIIAPFVQDLKFFCVPETCHSPHGGGITCLSATTLWWSLNSPFSDQMTHLEMFPNYGRRYSHFLCPCNNLCSSACPII